MEIPSFEYPFDPTGALSSNLIDGERKQLIPANGTNFHFLIPDAAPFFQESVQLIHHPSGKVLVEGADYFCTHYFHDASLACGKPIYGSFSFLDPDLFGVAQMRYQTVGGEWTVPVATIELVLASNLANPRVTTWEQIIDLPRQFPVIDHPWDLADMVGASAVVEKLNAIEDAILESNLGSTSAHVNNKENPHEVTKSQIGLSLVGNHAIASQLEAVSGQSNVHYMTPLRVREQIQAQVGDALTAHLNDHNNPHQLNKGHIGLPQVQDYPPASDTEAVTGTATNRYMTPANTAAVVRELHLSVLDPHINARNNPHGVDKGQIGLSDVQNYGIATNLEAVAGNSNVKYMTPQRTKEAIDAQFGDVVIGHVNDRSNPHGVDKAQIGLDKVINLPLASLAEAQAGTTDSGYMTPRLVAAAIDARGGGGDATGHIADHDNPHQVTAAQVNAYDKQQIDGQMAEKLNRLATANNANRLDGQSLADIVRLSKGRIDYPAVNPVDVGGTMTLDGITWTALAFYGPTEAADPTNPAKDIVFYLTGGDRREAATVPIYLVKLNIYPTPRLEVEQLAGESNDTQFGYVHNVGDGSITLYSRNPPLRNPMSALVLADPTNAVGAVAPAQDNAPFNLTFAETFRYNGTAANRDVPGGDLSYGVNPYFDEAYDFGAMLEFANVATTVDEKAQAEITFSTTSEDFRDYVAMSSFQGKQRNAVRADLIGWEWDFEDGTIVNVDAGSSLMGIVSPFAYTDYTFEVELSSTSTANMAQGVCAAYVRKHGKEHGIYVLRTPGGLVVSSQADNEPGGDIYKLFTVGYNLLQDDALDLGSTNAGLEWGDGVLDADRGTAGAYNGDGWNAAGVVRIRVSRTGNVIYVQTSQFGTTDVTQGSTVVIDLNSDPQLAVFKGATQWGIVKYKQANSRCRIVNRPDRYRAFVYRRFDVDGRDVSTFHRYNGQGWIGQPLNLSQSFVKPGRLVYNELGDAMLYYVRRDGTLKPLPTAAFASTDVTVLTK